MKNFLKSFFGDQRPDPKAGGAAKKRDVAEEPEVVDYFRKGDIICGNYEVVKVLGRGGFGIVYHVRSHQTGEDFALKTMRDELIGNSLAKKAFKKEALTWVNLDVHPNILCAMWLDESFGRFFITMELLTADASGRVTLGDFFQKDAVALDVMQMLKWAIQFCFGMEHAHAHGIRCHRDIKPANILIDRDGTLKISDFGLADAVESATGKADTASFGTSNDGLAKGDFHLSIIPIDGKVRCGTPGYMSPEVYRCEGADTRSDIYSFGLVLWQMATGSPLPPFMVEWGGDMDVFLRQIYEKQMAGNFPSAA